MLKNREKGQKVFGKANTQVGIGTGQRFVVAAVPGLEILCDF